MEVMQKIRIDRIPQLDGVRGIAIFLVLIWHYQAGITAEPGSTLAHAMRLLYLTWSGVDLFFVLSGFLIGGILIDNKSSVNYFRSFYVRRCCRILPLYFLVLAIGFFIANSGVLPLSGGGSGQATPWLWYLSFTQNVWMSFRDWNDAWAIWFGQTWSLAVEEQFYLLLPPIILFVSKRTLPLYLVAIVLAAPLVRYLSFSLVGEGQAAVATYVLLPCRMDALSIGVLIAIGMRNQRALAWFSGNLRFLYLLLAVSIVTAGFFAARGWGLGSFPMHTAGLSVLALLYGCFLLIALLTSRGPVAWLTRLPFVRQLGIWAYCLYLFHDFFPRIFFHVFGYGLSVSVLSTVALLAVAHLSWRYFEKPLIDWGHRWKYVASAR